MFGINGTLIVVLISFLVFVYLLDLVLWRPIARIKDERSGELKVYNDRVSAWNLESEQILSDIDERMSKLRSEHSDELDEIVESARSDYRTKYEATVVELDENKDQQVSQMLEAKKDNLNKVDSISAPLVSLIQEFVMKEAKYG